MQPRPYFYNRQVARYIAAFMGIFTGLTIRSARDSSTITVPIHYGSPDRVYAAARSGGTQNNMIRLPAMSAHLIGMEKGVGRNHGTGTSYSVPTMEAGGVFPNDVKIKTRLMPVPYDLTLSLSIMTTNVDSMMQILEQILVLFTPQISIQVNDKFFDWAANTDVILQNMAFDETWPRMSDRNTMLATLNFTMPIWIGVDSVDRNSAIQSIMLRVASISSDDQITDSLADTLDAMGEDYTNISPDLNTLLS